ncbi:proteasome assembly chaperone 2 [Agrilus planipennis]|uniref:Proteasome assembly chaperone 2 n=1 Tax=Agrilus planipennis TaxID=224129 RepID=A0A1W4X0B9_AGRPL|nr:proteasome assembly chaperone 2 [Agrilus planipennis]
MSKFINVVVPSELSLENYTLIIPSVSVGNVGQLTVDLLLASLKMEKVAIIWHPAIVPCVGNNPINDDKNEICTACELFINKEQKLAAIQIRSTIEFNLALDFLKRLKLEILQWQLKNVIILASTFAYEMHNIGHSPYIYLTNETSSSELLSELKQLEADETGKYLVYGSGYATKLFEVLSDQVRCTMFVKYTSEGDNRPDAMQMLSLISKYLNIKIDNVIIPVSWKYVFGNPPSVDIY